LDNTKIKLRLGSKQINSHSLSKAILCLFPGNRYLKQLGELQITPAQSPSQDGEVNLFRIPGTVGNSGPEGVINSGKRISNL
jgi:hypothetical protein